MYVVFEEPNDSDEFSKSKTTFAVPEQNTQIFFGSGDLASEAVAYVKTVGYSETDSIILPGVTKDVFAAAVREVTKLGYMDLTPSNIKKIRRALGKEI